MYGGGMRWTHGVPVRERGPDRTYRPDMRAPTVYGVHQPGIVTPQLRHAVLTVYDAEADVRSQLVAWTEAAETLMREGGVTVTIGLGPAVVAPGKRPVGLKPLPAFKGDALEATGGDLCALICSDAPTQARLPRHARWGRSGTHEPIGALRFRDGGVIPRPPLDLQR